MTRVLALDTAGATGWCLGDGAPALFGTETFGQADRAARWAAFRDWLESMVAEHEPKLLAYEKGFHRGAGSLALSGYAVMVEAVAYDRNLAVVPIPNATIRKHAGIRHGKLTEAARARGWPVADDHQADAAFLADFVICGLEEAA